MARLLARATVQRLNKCQVIIPAENLDEQIEEGELDRKIQDMRVGEAGWSVPWAISVDTDGRMWLDPRCTIHDAPVRTVQLLISRHYTGYGANVKSMVYFGEKFKWTRREGVQQGSIPVVFIH